jgi:predicted dehydrogenase
MIGQSCRFLPAIKKIKEYVELGTWGKPCRAEFSRYSQTPLWTWNNWILDPEMSGGCILDMHVHDVDMINHLFGKPVSVHSVMTENKVPLESIFTQYILENGMIVTTGADWSLPQKFPFEDSYFVNFEKACMKIIGDELVVYTDDEVIKPELDSEEPHLAEVREFIECVVNNKPSPTTPTESVLTSIKVALAECESAKTGKTVMI